jgi:hypothetical protein
MNNLPYLTSLPAHLPSWGKGDLSLVKSSIETGSVIKRGDGLEVLDLGNCSLDDTALLLFIPPTQNLTTSKSEPRTVRWPHLRSLSLHSNPLANTSPDYSTSLHSSPDLPSLQIIDARRVVERKRKGEIVEAKAEKRAKERSSKKAKPSGANVGTVGKVRSWGGIAEGDVEDKGGERETSLAKRTDAQLDKVNKVRKEGKRKRHHEDVPAHPSSATQAKDKVVTQTGNSLLGKTAPSEDRPAKKLRIQPKTATPPAIPSDPSTLPAHTKHKPSRTETAVVQVIEVAKDKGEKNGKKDRRGIQTAKGGEIDLKEVFGKKEEDGTGLGVGGW